MSYDLGIVQLRKTKAEFAASNPTVLAGQLCIETDTNTYTVGAGAYLSIRGNAKLSGEERVSADDVWKAMSLADDRDSGSFTPYLYLTSGSKTGIYRYAGIYEGKGAWVLNGVTFDPLDPHDSVIWVTGEGWLVTDENTASLYTSSEDVATPDLVGTWVVESPASAPAPSIFLVAGPSLQEALEQVAARVPNENRIRFTVTQSGSDAPEMEVIVNTAGDLGTWSRVTDGTYRYTKTGAFKQGKTWWTPSSGNLIGGAYTYSFYRVSDNVMQLDTLDSGTPSDEILTEPLPLEIITT